MKVIVGFFVWIGIAIASIFGARQSPPAVPAVPAVPTNPIGGVSIAGMKQYTDSNFSFSFWYPSALQATATTTQDDTEFPGGTAVESIQVGPAGAVTIFVVNSPTATITDEPADHASPIAQTKYFYDYASAEWMVAFPQGNDGGGPSATTTADISKTTMSGLVILPSGKRFDTTIVPLSQTRFLVITDGGGSSFTNQLAQTVTQSGATVAPSVQKAALQAELTAYGME